ncbi:MAG: aldo/keto reductase [Bacillota bacterium]|nr:aldo/keto reductase [Bacillota bacterium]
MNRIRLGRTNLMVSRSGFGAIPIQRIGFEEAREMLWTAYESGINFYDTARVYTDSEEKIGYAFSSVRKEVILATKVMASDRKELLRILETSLAKLKTDYVDLLQIHNPDKLPDPSDPESFYRGLMEAKAKGLTRFIGLTNHKLNLALKAAESKLYDTIQFPLSYLSTSQELELTKVCRDNDIGLIAMKALSGGLITDVVPAFAFLRQYDNIVPIWGIEEKWQLEQFIALEKEPPVLDSEMLKTIEKDRAERSGSFCRGCGYCMPCPEGIPIPFAARMKLILLRFPPQVFLNEEWKEKMELIYNCQECGQCKENCPYELDTPNLLKNMLQDYLVVYNNRNVY